MKNTSRFIPKRFIGEYGRDKIRRIGAGVWDNTIPEKECMDRCLVIWDVIDKYERGILTADDAAVEIAQA
jgi:hypothetical protein